MKKKDDDDDYDPNNINIAQITSNKIIDIMYQDGDAYIYYVSIN